MPRSRFERLSPDKRATILDAAKTAFAENGFEGASYNQIIQQAGLSKGAMYYYFDDKLDLYVTVLEDVNRQMMDLMGIDENWKPAGPFWPAMREICMKAWAFALDHPELAALMKGIDSLPGKTKREGRLGEFYGQWRTLLVGMLQTGQEQSEVRTDLPLELLVNAAIGLDEAVEFWLLDNIHEFAANPIEDVADTILDFWRRILKP